MIFWFVLPDFQLGCHSSLNIGIAHFVQQVVFVIDWPCVEVDHVMMSERLWSVVGIPIDTGRIFSVAHLRRRFKVGYPYNGPRLWDDYLSWPVPTILF